MIVATAIFALSLLATLNCVLTESESSKLSCQWAYRTPINETTSEILSDGSIRTIQGDVFDSDDYVEVNGTKEGCVCHLKTCIRKCCPERQMLVDYVCNGKVNVLKRLAIPEKVGPPLSNFHVTYGTGCGSSDTLHYMIDSRLKGAFYVSEKGILTLSTADNYKFFDYCLEYNEEYEVVTIVCHGYSNESSIISWLYITGMIVSTPFLLLTFIVYALLPEKNIYNRLLMCYVMSMMLGNVIILMIKFTHLIPVYRICTFIGTVCYFFYSVSLCCLNVIAYDIWSTFRNIRAPAISKSKMGKKRILFYSLYVIGISLIMVVVVITLTKTSKLAAWYNPNMGVESCWFSTRLANDIYFNLPMTITVLISTILFASTAWHIKKIKNDTKRLEDKDSQKHEKGKKMFIVYLKLCLVMGVNMAIVIIGVVLNLLTGGEISKIILYLTDVPFTFYGIVTFFLFVFKKDMWKKLKKRFNNESDVAIIRKTRGCHESVSSQSNVSNNTSVTEM